MSRMSGVSLVSSVLAPTILAFMSANVYGAELLATLPHHFAPGGVAEIFHTVWPATFYEEPHALFDDAPVNGPYPTRVDDILMPIDDPDFGDYVDRLTNGKDEFLFTVEWRESGLLGGIGQLESVRLDPHVDTFGPDLVGYEIEFIRRIFFVDLQIPGPDPNGDGIWTETEIYGSFEFYGSPIPEPNTLCLLGIAVILVGARRPHGSSGATHLNC